MALALKIFSGPTQECSKFKDFSDYYREHCCEFNTFLQVVAGSHELGQDYEHVTLLWERFLEFARDTESIGCERVSAVNEIADR